MLDNYNDTIELLNGVGYDGDLLKADAFGAAIADGAKSLAFRQLISWITDEIRVLANIEEKIHGDGDVNEFMLELSAFLKDMTCPFQSFITGPISERITSVESRVLLLDYLVSELMALRMGHKLKPKEDVVIEISETPAAAALKTITISLNMGKPPENIAPKMLFDKINSRIDEILQKTPKNPIGNPLFSPTKRLTKEQWSQLQNYQRELDTEYNLRRQMLITRLDVTIQSFQWSDRMKGKEDKIASIYTAKRNELDELQTAGKTTDLIALLAAREELAIIEKTSSVNVRKNTHASIQRHVIGKVPDRGGRAYEHAPPPPEMPSWQQNRSTGGGGGGGAGFGGQRGGGGGRGGGGFNSQQNRGGFQSQQHQPSQQQQQQQQGFPVQHGGYKQSVGYGGGGNSYQSQGFDNRDRGNSGGYDNRDRGGDGFDNRQRSGGGGGNARIQGGWSQGGGGGGHYSDRSYNDNRSMAGNGGGSYGGNQGYQRDNSFQRQKSNPFDQPYNPSEFYGRKGGRR